MSRETEVTRYNNGRTEPIADFMGENRRRKCKNITDIWDRTRCQTAGKNRRQGGNRNRCVLLCTDKAFAGEIRGDILI